jgi:hypothetical protein
MNPIQHAIGAIREYEAEIADLLSENERLRAALKESADCLESAIRLEKYSYESPPEPASAWDYEAYRIVSQIREELKGAAT